MVLRYVTLEDVRAISGITEKLINSSDLTTICEYAEYNTENMKNTSFTPKTTLDQINGNNTRRIKIGKIPLVKIRKLNIDGTDVDLDNIRFDKAGIIYLTSFADAALFRETNAEPKLIRIKYDYCFREDDVIQTTNNDDIVAGNSINIEVSSSSGFAVDDYIEIVGFDGKKELAKITNIPDGTHIIVDNLSQGHSADSLITKQIVPYYVKRLMLLSCALSAIAKVIGVTYEEIVNYQVGDYSVNKGVPYTHWTETARQLRREWEEMNNAFRVMPSMG